MNKKQYLIAATIMIGAAFFLTGCGSKNTNTNSQLNANVVVTEAPYTLSGATKVFNLKLVNGLLNYKTMAFHAGDSVQVRLMSDDQPVDFKFQNVPAESTNGIFSTNVAADDKGGTYNLICKDRECGSIAVTVISNPNASANTNSVANTNATANTNASSNTNTSGVTNVELQRLPSGTTFNPNVNMPTTTAFKVGDQFGISITGTFKTGDKSSFSITNSKGQTVDPQSAQRDLQTGTNGSCCYNLPATVGSYNLNVFVNSAKTQSVPITISAK
jgi:hypothetical protein